MIFVDSNIFLRLLTYSPDLPRIDQLRGERAASLFRKIERGEIEATTTEVVIHEVIFVLVSDRQYRYHISEVVPRIRHLLNLRGMRFASENMAVFNQALDLLESRPALGFADAVIAARTLRGGHMLATFDSHFDGVEGLPVWKLEDIDDVAVESE